MRICRHQLDLTFNSCHIISNRSVTNFSFFFFFFLRQLLTSTKKIFRPCKGLQFRFSRATIQLGGFSVLPQSSHSLPGASEQPAGLWPPGACVWIPLNLFGQQKELGTHLLCPVQTVDSGAPLFLPCFTFSECT